MTILYKYYNYTAGKDALKSQNFGFRKPKFFNDPFELTALSNNVDVVENSMAFKGRVDQIKDQVVILCLTRSAFNPLMWAHYADAHRGFVIGYDVSGPFLNSPDYNLVTADSGDVLYTSTKTPFSINPESIENLQGVWESAFGFDNASEQCLARRLFLTKHACWVYEEEVRVVKRFVDWTRTVEEEQDDPLRSSYILTQDLSPGCAVPRSPNVHELYLYKHKVPIREVYLGARNTHEKAPEFAELFQPRRKVFKLEVDPTAWSFQARELFPE